MKKKRENGIAGVDVILAVIAVSIFSALIVGLMYNNAVENAKLKKETLAMIYITEIFENVGMESFDNLNIGTYTYNDSTTDNIKNLFPLDMVGDYEIELKIEDVSNEDNYKILKKISVTLTYKVNGKEYKCSMERMKIKE